MNQIRNILLVAMLATAACTTSGGQVGTTDEAQPTSANPGTTTLISLNDGGQVGPEHCPGGVEIQCSTVGENYSCFCPPVPSIDAGTAKSPPPVTCTPNASYSCPTTCANGKQSQATCNPAGNGYVILRQAPVAYGICFCPEETIHPDASVPTVTTPPPPSIPDAGIPSEEPPVDAPIATLPEPDASVPVSLPDAFIRTDSATVPDASVPHVIVPDAAPVPDTRPSLGPDAFVPMTVVIPDAASDLGPDVTPKPDLGLDTTPDIIVPPPVVTTPDASPDVLISVDTYVAPDLGPDLKPDVAKKRDCGCTEKDVQPDLPPACWYGIPWSNDITLTLQECGGIEVAWQTTDCSTEGFKVVWIKYKTTDAGIDLPSYPNHKNGYEYLDNPHANSTLISGLASGTWTFRVCKFKDNETCGEYSNPAFITIP